MNFHTGQIFILSMTLFMSAGLLAEVPVENNIDYIKTANNSSTSMLIEASAKYKAGKITKDQYVEIALQVSQMADYYNKANTSTATKTTSIPSSNTANERVLIGTANNGKDKIYSIKINSWDQKYGYKVVIVPANPIISKEYELTVPYKEIKPGSNEIENILSNIPENFKVDKTPDNKPIVTTSPNTAGLWRLTKESGPLCVNSAETTPQPSGACKIGEKATSTGAAWANHLIPAQKKCLDQGLEKVRYDFEFTCIADIYQNAGGM